MSAGPGGFGSAPITKLVFLGTACSSLVQQVARASNRRVPFFVNVFTKAFAFQHPGELLVGSILLYHFRLFERQLGTGKYGAFVVVSGVASKLMEVSLGRLLALKAPAGPYSLIFANYVNYFMDVPSTQRFRVFGWPMTDKAFLYLAGIQLFFSAPKSSFMAAACGFFGGLVYKSNILNIQRLRVPGWLMQLFQPAGNRHIRTGQRPATRTPAPAAASSQAARGPVAAQPSPEALEQLMAMGFDRNQAAAALAQTQNNVQNALAMLL